MITNQNWQSWNKLYFFYFGKIQNYKLTRFVNNFSRYASRLKKDEHIHIAMTATLKINYLIGKFCEEKFNDFKCVHALSFKIYQHRDHLSRVRVRANLEQLLGQVLSVIYLTVIYFCIFRTQPLSWRQIISNYVTNFTGTWIRCVVKSVLSEHKHNLRDNELCSMIFISAGYANIVLVKLSFYSLTKTSPA